MESIRLLFGLIFALLFVYVCSWPLRDIFKMGQGPLLKVEKGLMRTSQAEILLVILFRICVFYTMVVGLITLGSAGLVSLFELNPLVTEAAILAALFTVAVARLLTTTYSGSMMQSLYALSLSVLGAMGFQFIVNAKYAHNIVQYSMSDNSNLVRIFTIGVISVAIVGEIFWYLGSRKLLRARQISYSLFREYHEEQEPYEMAAYRKPVQDLFINTIDDTIGEMGGMGLTEFYWKTWSGDPIIADALLRSVCRRLSAEIPFDDLDSDQQDNIKLQAQDHLRTLHSEKKACVIMPLHPEVHNAHKKVAEILGIEPIQIPDIGIRRYLIINRQCAIISLPIPAEYDRQNHKKLVSTTGSNFAIVVRDPSRVHDCIVDFESLRDTFERTI